MLSAVCGFKIKSCLFDGIDSIVEDWIVDQMHLKGGGTIDLEPYLTHSSTTEPTLAPMAVERTTTTRAATSIPAGKHLMDLVAVDWFKDTKRMDHVARRQGCAAQVASEKGLFSLIFNLQVIARQLVVGSLLQRFVDGDDEFRNSRLKFIPSVPKINVDIGSSTVANGVLGLVIGVIATLVVDMAFLVQANTTDELPERLIGAVRVSHIELKSAVVPKLEPEIS
ncbi:protein ENHANCED DISEASE RESISTANCE 2-like [Citrus sinensis]|nr:protein ENHANCED DISEASE RESISTANCE 2-like [Citrus sinensis]